MKHLRLLPLTAVACLLLASCQQSADFGGQPIDTVGSFPCFQNQLIVNVTHAHGRQLNYTVRNKKASFGPSTPALDEDSRWLIVPDAQNSVWIYDGQRDVTHIEIYQDGGAKFTSLQMVPDLLDKAPADFVSRLPAKLKSS
jgi:hypothetical protein